MSDGPVYVNDILPPNSVSIELDGTPYVTYPKKFSSRLEMLVREAYVIEDQIMAKEDLTIWERTRESRKVFISCAQEVLPLVIAGLTKEDVENELTIGQISTLFTFFLHSASETPSFRTVPTTTGPDESSTPSTPESPEQTRPPKLKAPRK